MIEIVCLFSLSILLVKFVQIWKYLATIRNDVKAIAAIYVTTYPEMSPPPGLTVEQQVQYTKDKVAVLAGDDIQFTGEDYDDLVSIINHII